MDGRSLSPQMITVVDFEFASAVQPPTSKERERERERTLFFGHEGLKADLGIQGTKITGTE